MIIRRRFRPLGKLLQRFGRGQINNYTHTTNMASRADVPPVWEEDTQQPLVWSEPDVHAAPPAADFSGNAAPVQRRSAVQRAPQPAPSPTPGDSGQRRTPPDLWKIHDAHTKMLEEEGYRMPPSPWTQPVDPETASRLPAPPSGTKPNVQRRAQSTAAPDPAPASRPANIPATPAPPTVSGRRRGRVIEETTPPVEGEEAPVSMAEASFAPDEEAPAWETELETAEDRPDLFEALMSEGVVQRRIDPDLSDAETFTPQFRPTPAEAPADSPSPPSARSAASNAPSTSNVQRSETPQRPRAERAAQTLPQAPTVIQGSAAPVQRQSDDASEYYADDEADIPPSLVPAAGTTEADLLDMLGLPPDTPVRGLNPAAAMPSETSSPAPTSSPASSSAPAAPVQRQSAPPPVQRAESTPASTPANPTPPSGQRVNRPPRISYPQQQTSSAPPESADIPASSAPTSLSNPTVMRQPEMPEAQEDAPEISDEGWSEEPAVSNFTSFFEAAEAAQTGSDWSVDAPADAPDWSEPESPANEPPGESLPHANPFPMSNPPAAMTSSSAPTRPTTPRVQRAEADLPSIDEDMRESFSDFDDTQPIDLSSSTPTPEASPGSSTTPASTPGVQRASLPASEAPGESYPRMANPSFIEENVPAEEPAFWSASDEVEPESFTPSAQPTQIAPDAPRSVGSSPAAPSVQRSESQPASSQPADSHSDAAPIGYYIEGLPENRSITSTSQISPSKAGDTLMRGKMESAKIGGKAVPEGMSMALPSKTTTDTVPGAVTAPSSGKTDGGPSFGGKTGGSPIFGGKTDPGMMPPPSTATTTTTNTLPLDEAVAEPSSDQSGEGGDDANPENPSGDQNNVDKLASDVYNLLRDRLRVEQERRTKR